MALTPFCPSHNRDRQLEIPMTFISVLVILLKNKNNKKKINKKPKECVSSSAQSTTKCELPGHSSHFG